LHLGHVLGEQKLKQSHKSQVILNMKLNDTPQLKFCSSCQYGKQQKKHFPIKVALH